MQSKKPQVPFHYGPYPSPTPTPSPSLTPSVSVSPSPSPSMTPSVSVTPSISISPTPTPSPSSYPTTSYSIIYDGNVSGNFITPDNSMQTLIGTPILQSNTTLTIEMYINPSYLNQSPYIGDIDGKIQYWMLYPLNNYLAFQWYGVDGSWVCQSTTTPINITNKWYHIAISINNGNIKMFVNGILQNLTPNSKTNLSNCSNTSGKITSGSWPAYDSRLSFYGKMTNIRIVKDALYESSFTPSMYPLAPVQGTSLLLNVLYPYNYLKDSSPNNFIVTPNGIASYVATPFPFTVS